jgi:hypothetical protein
MEIEPQQKDVLQKRKIIQQFQSFGFALRPAALSKIIEEANHEKILNNVKFMFQNIRILDSEHIQEAMSLNT